ncbi:ABC transporter C family protein (macronuclear) [Tetrahymena thermophila SB210]|uniref:ABC transporter C family protein n=1 Tax=Tetrahymena thermophila (strain SB210) TaxID=312017 RepID=I7LXB6_TETTS|nr:ABC transporter C family protein [Tetrahymena thermophila SB210]EAS04319.2 ABC transporter C family protein [Tetrahymena thermophila SB210]|eukprot:XP_001024564.2 ABC transporter C family protein [Tetrahymena thermophila SB210]
MKNQSQQKQEYARKQVEKEEDNFRMDNHTFWMGCSWFARQFYLNYSKLLFILRKNVISKNKLLQLIHLPNLEENLTVQSTLSIYESFLYRLGQKEEFSASDIYSMIKKTFRRDFILVHTFCILEIVCKIFNSVLIQKIITSFQDEYLEESSTYTMTVIYTLILFILIFLALNFRNKFQYLIELNSTQARQGLIALIYKKIIQMSQHQISKANVGKLFNMISADLMNIEILMPYVFQAIWAPLLIIATTVIICIRLGAYGLIAIGFILIVYPSQQILGKLQQKYFAQKITRSDERVKLINESIEGIRLIKMYAWENTIGKQVDQIREKEQNSIFNIVLNRAADRAFSNAMILIAVFLPILAIYYNGDSQSINLNSAKIFATLEQINGLKFMLILSGVGIGFIYQWREISKRFATFVSLKDQQTQKVIKNPKYSEYLSQLKNENQTRQANNQETKLEDTIKIDPFVIDTTQEHSNKNEYPKTTNQNNSIEISADFECFWEKNEKKQEPCVKFGKDVNFEKGKFYGIIGKVGSGKSSLFQILIREMPFYQGDIRVNGSIAYVEQEPYIFSGKVVDNILFGKEMDKEFYNKVIEACCLKEDLASFKQGDQTEIGERGITLSGGQKARLSLARAVYSNSDILLLDDPLSAVDAKVAKQINEMCLMGILKEKTILLVTHQVHFTKQCDKIFILDQGLLIGQGTFDEIKDQVYQIEKNNHISSKDLKQSSEVQNENERYIYEEDKSELEKHSQAGIEDINLDKQQVEEEKNNNDDNDLFTKDQDEQVKVSIKTLLKYFSQSKGGLLLACLSFIFFASAEILFTFFYRIVGSFDTENDKDKLFKNAGIILIFYTLATYLKYFSIAAVTYVSNKKIHRQMFSHLTRAPVFYFDSNPTGRIVNKFSSDIGTMDFVLFFHLIDCTENPLTFLNLMLTVSLYNNYFFILAGFYALCLYLWLIYSKELIVQSKSLDTVYKGPVMSLFSTTIQGVVSIKVYKQMSQFLNRFYSVNNDSIRTNHWFYQAGRAFSYNGQALSSFVTFFGILIAIYTSSNSDLLGQVVVYLTIIIELSNYLIRQMIQLEGSLTSVERVLKIINIVPEGPLKLPSDQLLVKINEQTPSTKTQQDHIKWVQKGSLEFKNVYMKYRENLDYVLKGVNLKIESGERIGCIGRTGAGKSSLLQVLFRMINIEKSALNDSKTGSILIDGVDISSIGLNTLRYNISIIPQTSFVFSGTVRKNIDPLGLYEDSKILEALKLTGLYEVVNNLEKKLDTDMSNSQSIFSVGQRQLICLARAILNRSKLVVLDEATANLDLSTDKLIQSAIKNQFSGSTIFTIAHRLNTIADYDKVLVMSEGCVAEFDSPYKLLVRDINDNDITSTSLFAQMVKLTGKQNSQIIFKIAKEKFFKQQNSNKNQI